MIDHGMRWLRLLLITLAGGTIGGCMTAVHSVVAPMMQSAYDASLTPEKAGITTSPWRGKSCDELQSVYFYSGELQKANTLKGDVSNARIAGWQSDAIHQVQSEQGCLAAGQGSAGSKVAAAAKVTAYGYCFASTRKDSYITPSFVYRDWYADSGAAEGAAFIAMLQSTYGAQRVSGRCYMEDSPEKAAAAIKRDESLSDLQLSWSTVRVNWTPPAIEKNTRRQQTSTDTVAVLPGSGRDPLALGLSIESPGPELARALGLPDKAGAWVIGVESASAAEKAGLKAMDVILDLNGQPVAGPDDMRAILNRLADKKTVAVGIWRNHVRMVRTLDSSQ